MDRPPSLLGVFRGTDSPAIDTVDCLDDHDPVGLTDLAVADVNRSAVAVGADWFTLVVLPVEGNLDDVLVHRRLEVGQPESVLGATESERCGIVSPLIESEPDVRVVAGRDFETQHLTGLMDVTNLLETSKS